MLNIREIVSRPQYAFMQREETLRGTLIFLVLGGSHAYGTANADSDIDLRGVAFQRRCDLLGLSGFEQFVDTGTDTVIYGVKKFMRLLCECNPSLLEMLGCQRDCYEVYSPCFEKLYGNRKMFLSRRAVQSFGGYARQQLRKLQNRLARNSKKEDPRLNKHAMHLVRLYFMGLDILEKEDIITYRKDELDLLRSIRNGEYQKADGTFRRGFFELVDACEARLSDAAQHTGLPEKPDMRRIEDLLMDINQVGLEL